MTANSFQSSPGTPATRVGLSIPELLVVTFRVFVRTWPVLVASYVVTVFAAAGVVAVLLSLVRASVDSPDVHGAIAMMVISLLVIWCIGSVAASVYMGVVAAVTDSTTSGDGTLRGIGRRVRARVGSLLAYSLIVGLGYVVIAWIPMLIPLLSPTPGTLVFAMILSLILVLGFTILVDLAPWIIVGESKGAIEALGASCRLAGRSFGRLLLCHIVLALGGIPLGIASEIGGAVETIALLVTIAVVLPGSVVYLAVVYADLRARERGVTLVVPPGKASMTITAAFRDFVDGWKSPRGVGPTTSGGPAAGQGNEPQPVPLRPDPSMTFNPPPGWPLPPDPSTLVGGFRPEPTWPPAPERWEFWVSADQPGATVSKPDGAPYPADAEAAAARTGRTGDSAALVAVPIIGLLVLAALGIGYLVNRQVEDAAPSNSASDYTYTETETPSYTENPDSPMANAIRGASVGDCVYKRSSGTTVLEFEIVDCSSGTANYIVTDTSTYTEYCPSSGTWTRQSADEYADKDVVVCLDRY